MCACVLFNCDRFRLPALLITLWLKTMKAIGLALRLNDTWTLKPKDLNIRLCTYFFLDDIIKQEAKKSGIFKQWMVVFVVESIRSESRKT